MKRMLFVSLGSVALLSAWPVVAAEKAPAKAAAAKAPAKNATAPPNRTDDEKALHKSAADFVAAFNAGDAKAVAEQFAADAEMVDLDGNVVQGREAIEKSYAEHFEGPPLKAAVEVESLRFISDNLAIEDGRLTFTGEDDDFTLRTHYTVVHVRQNGRWLVASSRDVVNANDRVASAGAFEAAWLAGGRLG